VFAVITCEDLGRRSARQEFRGERISLNGPGQSDDDRFCWYPDRGRATGNPDVTPSPKSGKVSDWGFPIVDESRASEKHCWGGGALSWITRGNHPRCNRLTRIFQCWAVPEQPLKLLEILERWVLKRAASAVQLRPWPPCFQFLHCFSQAPLPSKKRVSWAEPEHEFMQSSQNQ